MTTHWLRPATMKTVIFVCQLFLIIRTDAQGVPPECASSNTNRAPENSDITVICGTEFMDLSIYLCPIYNANYNESLMILNGLTTDECKGTADFTVDPPVIKFRLSVDELSLSACDNVFKIIDVTGTGSFSAFSNVQYVNVSGYAAPFDPAQGMITYRPSITYLYSCLYPLQYLLNNTQMGVAGVNLAINDNNGSFISTLSIELFSDPQYTILLTQPPSGLPLKQRIYVEVSATGLTNRFNVLLDRCFATVNKYEDSLSGYDLFVGCDFDPQTLVEENGISQSARFSFEAFRFVIHKNLSVSTFYIHCETRLCNVSMCDSMLPDCSGVSRRRRDTGEENKATVTSPAIIVGQQAKTESPSQSGVSEDQYSSPVVAVIVCVAILSFLLAAMGVYFAWHLRLKFKL